MDMELCRPIWPWLLRSSHRMKIKFPYLFTVMVTCVMMMILTLSRRLDLFFLPLHKVKKEISISTDQLIGFSCQASTLSFEACKSSLMNLSANGFSGGELISARRSDEIIEVSIHLAFQSFQRCYTISGNLLQETMMMLITISSGYPLFANSENPPGVSENLPGIGNRTSENLPHQRRNLENLPGIHQNSEDLPRAGFKDLPGIGFSENLSVSKHLHSEGILEDRPVSYRSSPNLPSISVDLPGGGGISEHLPSYSRYRTPDGILKKRHGRRILEILPSLKSSLGNCKYLLQRSVHVIRKCHNFASSPSFFTNTSTEIVKDLQAWMSGVLTWGNDCYSTLNHVIISYQSSRDITQDVNMDLDSDPDHKLMNLVSQLMHIVYASLNLTSNALSMLDAYDTYGGDARLWRPQSKSTLPGLQANKDASHIDDDDSYIRNIHHACRLVPKVVVSKELDGDYMSIQEAVDDAPENSSKKYVIYIKRGVYNETVRIPYKKINLILVGDGMGKTVITGNRNAHQHGITTYDTATVAVDGDGFVACDLTFENTASIEFHQAVALRVGSDLSQFYRCSFLGNQDTLYVHSLRQFYRDCQIEGTIDFIFGNAAAIFRNCEILIRPGRISSSIITAHGRTDPAQTTGIVFKQCVINGTEEFIRQFKLKPSKYKVYLGRPWKMYARTVYIDCVLERLVSPEGWRPWKSDFALGTLFYGEYNNSGLGANATHRVKWSQQISFSEAMWYSLSNFIQGYKWL